VGWGCPAQLVRTHSTPQQRSWVVAHVRLGFTCLCLVSGLCLDLSTTARPAAPSRWLQSMPASNTPRPPLATCAACAHAGCQPLRDHGRRAWGISRRCAGPWSWQHTRHVQSRPTRVGPGDSTAAVCDHQPADQCHGLCVGWRAVWRWRVQVGAWVWWALRFWPRACRGERAGGGGRHSGHNGRSAPDLVCRKGGKLDVISSLGLMDGHAAAVSDTNAVAYRWPPYPASRFHLACNVSFNSLAVGRCLCVNLCLSLYAWHAGLRPYRWRSAPCPQFS
jgi:hypothetical protein